MTRRWAPAVLAAAGLALAACGASGSGTTTSHAKPAPAASADQNLAGTCPATVVVQMAWTPEAEHGAIYHLVGPHHAQVVVRDQGQRTAALVRARVQDDRARLRDRHRAARHHAVE